MLDESVPTTSTKTGGADRTLTLVEFPTWFEAKLSSNLKYELHALNAILNHIRSTVLELCTSAGALRKSQSQLAVTPQISRILKLCDQIDTLSAQYGQRIPKLPGTSYILDMGQKLRNRIKTIDDMASSSKIVRTDAAVASALLLFRSLILQISSAIDELEVEQRQVSTVTDYIDYIHINVLDPISTLLQQNSVLSGNKDTQQILSAARDVTVTTAEYKELCLSEIFVRSMKLKRECVSLQNAIDDMLSPIRVLVKDKKVSAAFQRMDGITWNRSLISMVSCSIDEMLKHCRFSHTLDTFCDSLVQFLKLLHKNFFDLSDVPENIRMSITITDADEINACLRAWHLSINESESVLVSSEYLSAFKALLKMRQKMKQVEQDYNSKVKLHATSVAKYSEVYGQMVSMRTVLLKICAVDLGETDINIVLPQETP